jgi:DNA-binding NarL/FixJ family response regulator
MDQIRVILLAESRLLREALTRILRKRSDITIQAECVDFSEIPALVSEGPINVVLMDSSRDPVQDCRIVTELCRPPARVQVVLIGMDDDESVFLNAVQMGVAGYLLKDASAMDVIAAIRAVANNEAVCPPRLARSLFRRFAQVQPQVPGPRAVPDPRLTRRQLQLMPMIAQGLTNKEIASHLNLSEQTIKNHVHRMLRKFGAEDRLQAVEIASFRRPRESPSTS